MWSTASKSIRRKIVGFLVVQTPTKEAVSSGGIVTNSGWGTSIRNPPFVTMANGRKPCGVAAKAAISVQFHKLKTIAARVRTNASVQCPLKAHAPAKGYSDKEKNIAVFKRGFGGGAFLQLGIGMASEKKQGPPD
jgi:hypothetical protein